jgi:RNA polymerase sigma-70 factor (ECF subfamily)
MDHIIRAQQGDDDAFNHLIDEYKSLLYRTALAYVRNEDDAIEIVQTTVYKAYLSITRLKEPAYFKTWLTRILINCAVDYIRNKKRVIPFADISDSRTTSLQDGFENEELHDSIQKLDEKYKTVVILKYFHDLTHEQIAEILNCPVGTVKTRLHRALQTLRMDLKEECING